MGELMLEIERVLPVARPAAFAAFTDPDVLASWWGPEGFSIPSLNFEPRAGERYRIEMQPPEGEAFYLTGEFREVDPPERLAFTFAWEDPDPDDVETLARLAFRDRGGSTVVALTQGPFKTEARRELHRGGWTDSFDKLERLTVVGGDRP
jgi:uncharacterized protein YndB with AHSA1/START domain